MILAISAILAVNLSAREEQKECKGPKLSKEERIEADIQRLSNELFLSDKQAEKFAATYREYAAQAEEIFPKKCCSEKGEEPAQLSDEELDKRANERFENQKKFAELQKKFYGKFRKDLNARQTARVMRLDKGIKCDGPCHHKKADFKGEGHKANGRK